MIYSVVSSFSDLFSYAYIGKSPTFELGALLLLTLFVVLAMRDTYLQLDVLIPTSYLA